MWWIEGLAVLAVAGWAGSVLAQGMGMGVPGADGGHGQPQTQQPGTHVPQPQGQGINALFRCETADASVYAVQLDTSGRMQVQAAGTQEIAQGSYQLSGDAIRLSVPSINFNETSQQAYGDKGLLLAFQTPSIYCGLIAHEIGPAVQGYAKCPTIGYVPGIGYQENAFELYADHSVKWRSWDELTAAADTLYSESYGVYLIEGNQFWMAFPFRDDKNFLTGTINQDGTFLINELEPDKGACVAQ